MLTGKEFSCIVVDDNHGSIIALPPTEIVKKKAMFDYKSKYLPGLSRKVTPIGLPDVEIARIRTECEELFRHFAFNVYARIDGFYTDKGEIFLNDPNTTSGMMPSSFFFHQAAEIGLNPSQFLTYLIHCSLSQRLKTSPGMAANQSTLKRLNDAMAMSLKTTQKKKKVAVLLGGYSTERHISVESGRNIFEKLSSSINYDPFPVFLTGNDQKHELFVIPINMMLKDNADDIKQKVKNFNRPALLDAIVEESKHIIHEFVGLEKVTFEPRPISYAELSKECDAVFIALHGRPGEDGAVQAELEKVGLPYNGSGQESSGMTINKFETNNLLRDHGFLVAGSHLVVKEQWELNKEEEIRAIEKLGYPFIAKPSDEGCSSAVIKIRSKEQLLAYADICFRSELQISPEKRNVLNLDVNDEFPFKGNFLVETFIDGEGADHFLEVTGGLLTSYSDAGEILYEVFEPSEALAEGEVLSLAEKFLAGEGQNITPARFDPDEKCRQLLSNQVKMVFGNVAKLLKIEGYCRIDAFVRIYEGKRAEVIIIEINSLPGMTPATCIYHQASINGYKPFDFIDKILNFGEMRQQINQREKIA
jgi:D-alanine-D-alanine ligase